MRRARIFDFGARIGALALILMASGCEHAASVSTETAERTTTAATASPSSPPRRDIAFSEPSTAPVIVAGSGKFFQSGAVRQAEGGSGDITLNFVDTDIREVARSVLGDILHLNYAIDPRLQTTVTVQTSKPLRLDQVLPTFQEVLRATGLGLVEAAGLYRVAPLDEASRSASHIAAGQRSIAGGVNVQIIPLKFASAAELRRTIEPFLPRGAALQADNARNLLILTGAGQELETVTDLVSSFDTDWLAAMSYAIFPIRTGSARALVDELDAVFGPGGAASTGGMRFAPLERMNAILVVSPQRGSLDEARKWIERLDRGNQENAPQLFEYHVQNSRASDLAKVLSELLQGSVRTVQPQNAPVNPAIASMMSTTGANSANGLPSSGANSANQPALPDIGAVQQNQGAAQQALGQPDSQPTLGAGLAQALGTNAGAGDLELPKVRIVADEKNNALVIYARPHDYRMIEDAIERLDVVPLQVLIEATIAEVTLNNDLQFGLQWFFSKGKGQFELSSANAGAMLPTDLTGSYPGFNYVFGGDKTKAVLSALSSVTHVNVVSAPELLVLDHHTAALQVGDQVPVITQTAASTITSNPQILNSVQYLNTGVVLQVTPRVNSSGLVTLDIDQAVSDVSKTTTSSIDSPTITQRRIITSAVVQDGETIALGGLMLKHETDGRGGIPILSDIPYVGALFGTTTRSTDRTELLVMLTPRIVRNPGEARSATEELRGRLQSIQLTAAAMH